MTLSIGDGANDVAMIQSANVGVGIFGNEGLQAAMNSDFAICKFHHLKRLLFVHGAQNYERSATMLLYFTMKHYSIGLFCMPMICYAAYITIVAYDDLLYATVNILWNSLHPIINPMLDQHFSPGILEKNPKLYNFGRQNYGFSTWIYLGIMLNGVYVAMVCFYFGYFMTFKGHF